MLNICYFLLHVKIKKRRKSHPNWILFPINTNIYKLLNTLHTTQRWTESNEIAPQYLRINLQPYLSPYYYFFSISTTNDYTLAQQMVATRKHKQSSFLNPCCLCVFLHCETITLLTTWEVANYKYKGIGNCGGLGSRFCFSSNSTVTTTLSGLEGWHGHGMAMNLGTSSPGINTGKLGPLFCRNS